MKTYFCTMPNGERRQINPKFHVWGEARISAGHEIVINGELLRVRSKRHQLSCANPPLAPTALMQGSPTVSAFTLKASETKGVEMGVIRQLADQASQAAMDQGVMVVGADPINTRFITWKSSGRNLCDFLEVGDEINLTSPNRITLASVVRLVHLCGLDSGYLTPRLTLAFVKIATDDVLINVPLPELDDESETESAEGDENDESDESDEDE